MTDPNKRKTLANYIFADAAAGRFAEILGDAPAHLVNGETKKKETHNCLADYFKCSPCKFPPHHGHVE